MRFEQWWPENNPVVVRGQSDNPLRDVAQAAWNEQEKRIAHTASDYDLVIEWMREQKSKRLPPAPPHIVAAAQRLQERLGNTNAELSPWMRAILRLE